MLPDNVVDQIKAVQDVVDGSVAAGGGVKSALDLVAGSFAATTASITLGALIGVGSAAGI